MRAIITIIIIIIFNSNILAQQLILNKTVWVGSDSACFNGVLQVIRANDGGILLTGVSACTMDNGYIKGCPYGQGNVAIGKLDSDLNPLWIKAYGGSDYEVPKSFVEMDNGDIFILSSTHSTDGDVGGQAGGDQLWLTKHDKNGNLLWSKVYGSPYTDEPAQLAITPDKQLIICASVYGMGGDVPTQFDNDQFISDIFVFKADTSGNILWKKVIGGSGSDGADAIVVRPDGYYLICTSSSHDNSDFADTGWRQGMPSSIYTPDLFVFKLDTAGNTLWSKSYGGSEGDWPLQAFWDDRDSTLIIKGHTGSMDHYFSGFSQTSGRSFIMKLDSLGNSKWVKPYKKGYRKEILAPYQDGYVLFRANAISSFVDEGEIEVLDKNGNNIISKTFGNQNSLVPADIIGAYKDGFLAIGSTYSIPFGEGDDVKTFSGNHGGAFFSYYNYFPLSIANQNKQNPAIQLYPNPTENTIHIDWQRLNTTITTIQIFDHTGKKVYERAHVKNHELTLDLSAFAKGIYHAVLTDDDAQKHTASFIKN